MPKHADPKLINTINSFIRQQKTTQKIARSSDFWSKKYSNINHLDIISISNDIKTKLPKLRALFIQASVTENINWTLLAALAYQESKWELDAVSPTNVRGLMQLTQSTADFLGVNDRTDPEESINGAAKYIRALEKNFPVKVKRSDRIWLAVAAYNLGIGRIRQAYRQLHDEQSSEITWDDVANKLTTESTSFQNDQYSTGARAVEYVERIREFQKILRYYPSE